MDKIRASDQSRGLHITIMELWEARFGETEKSAGEAVKLAQSQAEYNNSDLLDEFWCTAKKAPETCQWPVATKPAFVVESSRDLKARNGVRRGGKTFRYCFDPEIVEGFKHGHSARNITAPENFHHG
jgi:hypothetical protein